MNPVFIILAIIGFGVVGIALVPILGKAAYKVIDKLQKEWNGEDIEEEKEEKEE